MRTSPFALLLLGAAGCVSGVAPVTADDQAIIGGTTDTDDPGVVLLYMTVPGKTGGALCTGEVVSPHVVLTAAHCTGGEDPTVTNARWAVYLGSDFGKATTADLLPVKETHYHELFDVNRLDAGHDIGVAILDAALPASIQPLKMNRVPLDASHDGGAVRFVGYGLDNAKVQSGAGVKRQTSTTLTDHTSLLLHFTDGAHETCNGDSGGPAFMTLDGQEVIVGLTSYGDINCDQGGYDTRVDALATWVDKYVVAVDPPPPSTTPPPASGSGAQLREVGASCVSDHDCQSHVCGLTNRGTNVCLAVSANNDSGSIGGCSVGSAHGDGLTATLLFGLAVCLARALRRRPAT